MPDTRTLRVQGLHIVPPLPARPVSQTRTLLFPDGTRLICRARKTATGTEWTAEIPLAMAKEIFTDE